MRGVVMYWYQSEPRSSQSAAGREGQPISTWKPAIAVPKAKPFGKVPTTPSSPPGAFVAGSSAPRSSGGTEATGGAPAVSSAADEPHATDAAANVGKASFRIVRMCNAEAKVAPGRLGPPPAKDAEMTPSSSTADP